MTNQTDQKDKNNRDKMTEEELKTALRPIWQGRQDSNLRPTVLETATLPTELLPYAPHTEQQIHHTTREAFCHLPLQKY